MADQITQHRSSIIVHTNGLSYGLGYIVLKGSIEKYLRDKSTNTTYYRITLSDPDIEYPTSVNKDDIIPNTNKTIEEFMQDKLNSTKIYCFVVAAINREDIKDLL